MSQKLLEWGGRWGPGNLIVPSVPSYRVEPLDCGPDMQDEIDRVMCAIEICFFIPRGILRS